MPSPTPVSADNLQLGNYIMFVSELDANGLPGALRDVGNVSVMNLGTTPDVLTKRENRTNARGAYKKITKSTDTQFKFTFDEITIENMCIGLFGTEVAFGQSSGTLTDAALAASSVQGMYYNAGKRVLSSVVVEDDGVAATLGDDYTVDAATGLVYVVPGGGIVDGSVLTISASYAAVSSRVLRGVTDTNPQRYVFLKADPTTGAAFDWEFWKMSFVPDGEFGLISEDFAGLSVIGTAELDDVNHPDEPYYRAIQRVAA